MSDKLPNRKRSAEGVLFIEGKPTVIFDTVCTKNRTKWLSDESVHSLLIDVWQQSWAWLVGRYVIMPDHIHFFAWATESSIDYEDWVSAMTETSTTRFYLAGAGDLNNSPPKKRTRLVREADRPLKTWSRAQWEGTGSAS